jgi:VCBS repeat protein/ASPIC/UnbV protein
MRFTGAAALALAIALSLSAARQQTPRPPAPQTGQEAPDDRTWNRRAPGAGDYKTILEVSGREEVYRFFERPSNPEDLRSICDAKRQAAKSALAATEQYLASLTRQPPAKQDVPDIIWTRKSLGQIWDYQGQMARAIEQFGAAYRSAVQHATQLPELVAARSYLAALLGVTELRRGELENCVQGHASASCIVPIGEGGQHHAPSGSQNAIKYLTAYLAEHPDDLDMRWLLNVAYMTLGKYPASVPPEYRIDPAVFTSAENPGRFVDVAAEKGLAGIGHAGGVVIEDLDNDGLPDVVVSSVDSCESLRYFHHERDGTFRDMTDAAHLSDQLGGLNMTATDYNNDGFIDLFVMRGGWEFPMRNSLLRNNGDGTFTDVTKESGLSSALYRTHSAAWADFDNDGWVDVFVGHEEAPSSLFKNMGNGTFKDVTKEAGVGRTAFTKGAAWGDYDNDGYPDLYVSNYVGENFLYHNERNGTFTERAKTLGVEKPIMSFPTWFFDYDNDGWLDLFVADFVPSVTEVVRGFLKMPRQAETMKLYHNNGKGGFEDVTAAMKLDRVVPTMGANFGDIDNDGYLDIYLGTGAPSYAALTPNFLFRNHDGKYFVDVTSATGTGHLQKGHGVAFADLDGDGQVDIFENMGGFVPGDAYYRALFKNPGHDANWIRVKLVGVKTNRAAIGAKIKAILDDGSIRYREVSSGGSFGASPFAQHIGLGKGHRVKTLEIWWPTSNIHQTLHDLPINQEVVIKESARQ